MGGSISSEMPAVVDNYKTKSRFLKRTRIIWVRIGKHFWQHSSETHSARTLTISKTPWHGNGRRTRRRNVGSVPFASNGSECIILLAGKPNGGEPSLPLLYQHRIPDLPRMPCWGAPDLSSWPCWRP